MNSFKILSQIIDFYPQCASIRRRTQCLSKSGILHVPTYRNVKANKKTMSNVQKCLGNNFKDVVKTELGTQ